MNSNPATLSVCVIYGNESAHIERFIESFAPVADDFVFVRALGARRPDDTLDRIKKKCSLAGVKLVLGEYLNLTEETQKWPHVDRFDKARQVSFDLATGDLRMWADCDDILPPQSIFVINSIKNDAERSELYFGMYNLPSSDTSFLRERIVGRISCRWMSPVHESIIFGSERPPTRLIHEGLVIEHRPLQKPMLSVDRNLKILEHAVLHPQPDDWEPQNWFYIHRDNWIHPEAHQNRGIERSVEAGLKAISFPGLGMVERYEVFLNISEALAQYPRTAGAIATGLSADDEKLLETCLKKRETWLLNALRLDPSRREALAALSLVEHDRKAYARALAWAVMMRGIPEPQHKPWTHQRAFYSWKGALLLTLGYRRTGQEDKARQIEEHVFGNSARVFSVLHATRRGDEAVKSMYLWLSTAQNAGAIEWIFAVDEDDATTLEKLHGYRVVKVNPGGGPVAAWNEAAKASSGKILIQMSDDWFPSIHWDATIAQRMGEKIEEEAVLRISDGHRKDDLMCMAILTRKYYDRYGYVFYPEYFSMYSDNEFSLQAKRDGVVIEAPDVVFQHNHPVFTGSPMDEVYQRSNAPEVYKRGEEILISRMELLQPK